MADAETPSGRITPAERARLKREEKLADLQSDIESGRVVVRQMSAEELAAFEKQREARSVRRGKGR